VHVLPYQVLEAPSTVEAREQREREERAAALRREQAQSEGRDYWKEVSEINAALRERDNERLEEMEALEEEREERERQAQARADEIERQQLLEGRVQQILAERGAEVE
jgi:hypothetical protein